MSLTKYIQEISSKETNWTYISIYETRLLHLSRTGFFANLIKLLWNFYGAWHLKSPLKVRHLRHHYGMQYLKVISLHNAASAINFIPYPKIFHAFSVVFFRQHPWFKHCTRFWNLLSFHNHNAISFLNTKILVQSVNIFSSSRTELPRMDIGNLNLSSIYLKMGKSFFCLFSILHFVIMTSVQCVLKGFLWKRSGCPNLVNNKFCLF